MRIREVLFLSAPLACTSCASHSDEIARLQSRLTTLEAQVAALSSTPAQHDSSSASNAFVDVPIELGEAEFYDGDSITITEIRGSHATVAKGGTYVVKGRYHLASRDGARLLLSVTATEGSGRSETEPDSVTTVAKGDGEFTLVKRVDVAGYPHLTFYGADGHPFGGVYFGHGESLLGKKGWSYRTP